jgi:hypothetical protein
MAGLIEWMYHSTDFPELTTVSQLPDGFKFEIIHRAVGMKIFKRIIKEVYTTDEGFKNSRTISQTIYHE